MNSLGFAAIGGQGFGPGGVETAYVGGAWSVSGHITPSATATYDIGSSSLGWRALYATNGISLSSALALGTTPIEAKGLVLRNSTAAALGAQQVSPAIYLAGQGWETTGGSSDEVIFRLYTLPIQSTTSYGVLNINASVNGGAYGGTISLGSDGTLYTNVILPNTDNSVRIGNSASSTRFTNVFITGAFTSSHTRNIGTGTGTFAADYANTTAAVAGTVQNSPATRLTSQCWETTGGTSQSVYFQQQVRPVQGATSSGALHFSSSVNGAAIVDQMSLSSAGLLSVTGSVRAGGDSGGAVSTVTLTNATAAADTNAPTHINTPTGVAGAQAGWVKIYVGATAAYVPYWTA